MAAAYYVLARVGIQFQFGGSQASPVWPASGLALAAVLLWGFRLSPGIFLGTVCATITDFYGEVAGTEMVQASGLFHYLIEHPQHILVSIALGLGNTLEAIIGGRLIQVFLKNEDIMGSIRGVLIFCSCALIACLISSPIGTVGLAIGANLAPPILDLAWLTRWLGHITGILIVTPFLITWWSLRNAQTSYFLVLPAVAALILLFVFNQIIFTGWFEIDSLRRAYLVFPILLVITFKFGAPAATIGVLITSASAAFATLTGKGPLAESDQIETLILLQGFLSIVPMTVLLLDATNSERRRALAESTHALEQFRTLFNGSPNGLVAVNSEGVITLLNTQAEGMFGYHRDELVGKPLQTLVPTNPRTIHSPQNSFDPPVQLQAGHDLFGRRKDGRQFPIEILLSPLETHTCALELVTIIDITQRKRAEERLSAALIERNELRRHLMQAQEQERLRLSRELHDQTGQMLMAAMLEVSGIESQVDQQGRNRLRQLRNRLEQIETTISRIAWELRPASIDELGLASALTNYVSEWSRQFNIEADVHCPDDDFEDLGGEIRTAIYRIAQEVLTNIAKHAKGVTAVSLILDRAKSVLRLTVEDNGCGFHTETLAKPRREFNRGGHGIPGMRERLLLIGGELEIESTLNVGTTVFIRIPLTPEKLAI